MRVSASSNGKHTTTEDVITKPPKPLTIPFREIKDIESLVLGFRSEMLSMGDGIGRVLTGSGLGNDFIILKWKKKEVLIRGSELLRAWVKTFAPKDAKRFPESIKEIKA